MTATLNPSPNPAYSAASRSRWAARSPEQRAEWMRGLARKRWDKLNTKQRKQEMVMVRAGIINKEIKNKSWQSI